MRNRLSVWLGFSLAIHAGLVTVALHGLDGLAPPLLLVDLGDLHEAGEGPLVGGKPPGSPTAPAAGAPRPRAALAPRAIPPAVARPPAPLPDAPPGAPPAITAASPPVEPTRPVAPEPPRVQPDATPAAPAPAIAPRSVTGAPVPAGAGPALGGPGAGEPASPSAGPGSTGTSGRLGSGAPDRPTVPGEGAAGSGGGDGAALTLAIPGEGAGDGVADAMYDEVYRRLRAALVYPSQARQRRLTGVVELELEIQPSGAITRVMVVASSSHRILDDAAVETLRGLGRLPFPPDVRPRPLRIRVPVEYVLR